MPRTTAATGKRRRSQERDQHGIAVLLVVACLAILVPFTASFNYQARVDWQSAVNLRDEVAARNIQRGGARLSLLLFELQRMVFNQRQFREFVGAMDITQVAPYLMSVFGTTDGAEGLGALVGMDTSSLNHLALTNGSFEVRLEAESGKLNVNCLANKVNGNEDPPARVVETLEALMLPTLYDSMFDEEKVDGQRYLRQDVSRAIADYIDDDRKRFDLIRLQNGSAAERYRYQELFDPYQERNARLDTIDELHLVEGVDDDWMTAFGSELTVYGGCKVNLNFASAEQIALVIRHSVKADERHKTEGDNFMTMTMPLANFIVQQREFNLFEGLVDFRDMVKTPDKFMNPLTMLGQPAQDQVVANLPRIPEGMTTRVKEGPGECAGKGNCKWGGIRQVATVSPERIYRVEIITEVGAVRKRLTAVYDMEFARAQSQGKGAWLYWRED